MSQEPSGPNPPPESWLCMLSLRYLPDNGAGGLARFPRVAVVVAVPSCKAVRSSPQS